MPQGSFAMAKNKTKILYYKLTLVNNKISNVRAPIVGFMLNAMKARRLRHHRYMGIYLYRELIMVASLRQNTIL